MDLFFRYDDLAARSWHGGARGELQFAILDEFAQARVPLSVAAIPVPSDSRQHPLDSDALMCDTLVDAVSSGRVDLAVHGFGHTNLAPASLGRRSEFYGRSYQSQYDSLSNAKRLIEGILGRTVETFVPPWNTFDVNTATAARSTGFRILSASNRPIIGHLSDAGLKWLPVTSQLGDLPALLERAPRRLPSGTILGIILHVYDFVESGDTRGWLSIKGLRPLLHRVREGGFSFLTLRDLASREPHHLGIQRYRANALACRFATTGRLRHFLQADRGMLFAQWYWPSDALWLRLATTCTPLANLWDSLRV